MNNDRTLTGNEEKMATVLRDTKMFHEHTMEETKKEIERHKADVAKSRRDYDSIYNNVMAHVIIALQRWFASPLLITGHVYDNSFCTRKN